MPRDWERLSSCEGKQGYGSFTEALKVVQRRRKRSKGRVIVHPYRCRFCQRVHLGRSRDAG